MSPSRLTTWIEQGVGQLHCWDATDSVYTIGAVVIVYMFTAMRRDQPRRT